jgi:hypothetical protein
LADRCGGFSLELILAVHLPDPIPNCQTANVETIIAQIRAICTGNFVFLSPQDKCGHPARRLASARSCPQGASRLGKTARGRASVMK